MTDEYLTSTTSTCRECGRLLPAQVWLRPDGVWFRKHCPQHGPQDVRVYGDAAQYLALPAYTRPGSVPMHFATTAHGCPDSCGLCPDHEQHVCMPNLEITDHCDLACPICLVKTPGTFHLSRAQLATILDRLLDSEGQIDVLNLSGGEPTMHPDFRTIIDDCMVRKQILHLSVSTNGQRLAREPDLLRFCADRGVIIALQFDGLDPTSCLAMRGRDMVAEKRRLIDQVALLDGRMSLTCTVARGHNEAQLPTVLDLLFTHPHIASVMIQPMAYVGRGAGVPRPADALTIPDVLRAIDGACGGMVSADDFCPLPCSHPACFSLAFYLKTTDGKFVPLRRLLDADRYLDMITNRGLPGTDAQTYAQLRDAIYALWSGPSGLAPDSCVALAAVRQLLDHVNAAAADARTPIHAVAPLLKSIFIHHFMDRDTFDLSRARKCCQVYPLPDGRLMPACVYNCLRR